MVYILFLLLRISDLSRRNLAVAIVVKGWISEICCVISVVPVGLVYEGLSEGKNSSRDEKRD
jgi:hypothetical protein